jgi:hypothetical protein
VGKRQGKKGNAAERGTRAHKKPRADKTNRAR